ncbi:hypothetical protein N9S94_01730 [Candidatus Actinomarina]|jgi:hypothetical protein|nr:hypothetical protein [Actinomycetota bacterium]MDA8896689.1 hypothetical protein [Acidimicrobiia bacterium]MDA9593417.1 hypothetical protein [Candidatus Actinomarina sp.]MDA9636009.1 hypothetical protein [bacterium]MBT5655749.1 hypothetical protein [Actinomycetota bacterium]|tara:strand:+ start:140 stop:406 length:267 start_codon:yes stop_codon:yes gene_type:complete
MFDVELKIRTVPQVVEDSKDDLLKVIDSWSISKLEGMWKGKAEESVELSIICDVDKSKEVVKIIAQTANQHGEDSIMIGNSFLKVQDI